MDPSIIRVQNKDFILVGRFEYSGYNLIFSSSVVYGQSKAHLSGHSLKMVSDQQLFAHW